MKTFYKSLKDHAMEIISFGKKKMTPLIDEEFKSYATQKKLLHLQNKK